MAKQVKNGVDEVSKNQFETCICKPLCVVEFFADWCMPCLILAPVVEELAEKFKDKISFAKVNVDENRELSQKFGVMSIPTLVIFKNGESVEKITGSLPAEVIEERFKKYL